MKIITKTQRTLCVFVAIAALLNCGQTSDQLITPEGDRVISGKSHHVAVFVDVDVHERACAQPRHRAHLAQDGGR